MNDKHLLGVDTGGTFTDFVLLTPGGVRTHKVLSTPDAPGRAILDGIRDLGLLEQLGQGRLSIIHGSTVATNAALEGKGVRTAYVTNYGLGDLLNIARQTRRALYDLTPDPVQIPVPDELIVETGGRVDARGETIEGLSSEELAQVKRVIDQLAPRSVAINLLFSFLDDQWERQLEDLLAPDYFVSRSSSVLPEYKEYERGIATWLNAWLGPIMKDYLASLARAVSPSTLAIMQSSGRTMAADQAAERAVNLLLSGPAAGLSGALHMGRINHQLQLMSFDMGGTSTDVALIDGQIRLTSEGFIGCYPVAIPMADIHTIGSGGGSIAYLDEGGLLQVGPESAGAAPGPACYNQGGLQPTVTDANAVLGRLRAEAFLGGRMQLDLDAARAAITPLAMSMDLSIEETANGIIALANEKMIQALRVISIQRGYDPRQFRLICFGGAGGLHFCALAEALNINHALVPVFSGVLSALGMLVSPPGRELSRTHQCLLEGIDMDELHELLATLIEQGRAELRYEGISGAAVRVTPSMDLRYAGQSYTLNLPWSSGADAQAAFHQAHEARYGHQLARPVELVNVRVSLSAAPTKISLPRLAEAGPAKPLGSYPMYGFQQPVKVFDRSSLGKNAVFEGPALVTEAFATTLINPGWRATVDDVGNMLLDRTVTTT